VYEHSIRGSQHPLAGQTYLDTRGLSYQHAGALQTGGDLFKLRSRLGTAQTLTATYMSSNNYRDLICNQFTAALPCGFGPGNASYGQFRLTSLNDTALVGLVGLQFSLFENDSHHDVDLLGREIDGVPAPCADEGECRRPRRTATSPGVGAAGTLA